MKRFIQKKYKNHVSLCLNHEILNCSYDFVQKKEENTLPAEPPGVLQLPAPLSQPFPVSQLHGHGRGVGAVGRREVGWIREAGGGEPPWKAAVVDLFWWDQSGSKGHASRFRSNCLIFLLALYQKKGFGGIPNSSSIILLPRLTTWALFFLRNGSAHVDNVITKRCSKQSHGCPWQGCKTTNHTVTLRNLPNPASGTYTSAHRCLRNLHQHTPELSGTFRNLPSTHRNSPEPSGTCLRNLLLEPAPEHTGAYLGWRPL